MYDVIDIYLPQNEIALDLFTFLATQISSMDRVPEAIAAQNDRLPMQSVAQVLYHE